jgi:hypothetical protein
VATKWKWLKFESGHYLLELKVNQSDLSLFCYNITLLQDYSGWIYKIMYKNLLFHYLLQQEQDCDFYHQIIVCFSCKLQVMANIWEQLLFILYLWRPMASIPVRLLLERGYNSCMYGSFPTFGYRTCFWQTILGGGAVRTPFWGHDEEFGKFKIVFFWFFPLLCPKLVCFSSEINIVLSEDHFEESNIKIQGQI